MNDVLYSFQQKYIYEISGVNKATQILLHLRYKEMAAKGSTLPSFDEIQFRAFSQNGEDGILWYIFSLIGVTNKHCVEICAGNGIECNTANLIINHGWTGLLFDGNSDNVEAGVQYYARHPDTFSCPPQLVCAWITRDNVNALIARGAVKGEIDLLSLDMDGMDYWIWNAIEVISPRVVVVEYQDSAGPDRSITVPYSDDFSASNWSPLGPFAVGTSLLAMVKLAFSKGYRLVGTERYGFNAFFIKRGLGENLFPEISPADCFQHPMVVRHMVERWPKIKDLPWVKV